MGVGEILAFIKSLPRLVSVMEQVVGALEQLRRESIEKEVSKLKADVASTLKQIEMATTNDERKRLSYELATRISK